MEKNKLTLPTAVIIAGIMISGAIFLTQGNLAEKSPNKEEDNKQQATQPWASDGDPFLGPEDAKVTIVEFSDYQCPFCRIFAEETFGDLKKEYIDSGKSVKFVYRDFPLSIHPSAIISAEATHCADDQNKYWEMQDKIFKEQAKLGQNTIQYEKQDIVGWAQELNLNMNEFMACLDGGKYKDEVEKDLQDGISAGVTGTPTFFINGYKIVGAQPLTTFETIIDGELEK